MVRIVVCFAVATIGGALAQAPVPQADAKPAQSQFSPDVSGPQAEPDVRKEVTPEMRGDILVARKRYREAIDAYKEAGDSPVILNKIGIAYHQLTDLAAAKKYYERSIKVSKGKYAEAINNLGTIHYAQKSYRRAVSQYKKALKLSPNSASIYSNLGTAYFARKNYEEAMKAYETALSLDPDVFEHRGSAGVLLQERSVEERAKFHFYQAKLYAKNGMADRALMCLRRALEEGLVEDREKIRELPEFAALRESKEFNDLLAMQQRAL